MYTFGRYFPLLKGLSTDYIMPEFYVIFLREITKIIKETYIEF